MVCFAPDDDKILVSGENAIAAQVMLGKPEPCHASFQTTWMFNHIDSERRIIFAGAFCSGVQ
jgi:hypothetical protein